MRELAQPMIKNQYGQYLLKLSTKLKKPANQTLTSYGSNQTAIEGLVIIEPKVLVIEATLKASTKRIRRESKKDKLRTRQRKYVKLRCNERLALPDTTIYSKQVIRRVKGKGLTLQ